MKQGIKFEEAYRLGARIAGMVACMTAAKRLVPHLSFFPLAAKNFHERAPATLAVIFAAIQEFLDTISVSSSPMSLSLRGTISRLPNELAERLSELSNEVHPPRAGTMELQLLVDYDGHAEFAKMSRADMDRALANSYDIVLRTGGSFRLSGAPVLECSSADMFSLPMTFPEFTFNDLQAVVEHYLVDQARRALLRADKVKELEKATK